MQHRDAEGGVVMQHRTGLQPVEQMVAIGRIEHRLETAIGALERGGAAGHREEMQIVVAEYDDRRFAQRRHPSQHRERVRPAIDQVSDEPQPVAPRIEVDLREERFELDGATLHVADGVDRHGRLSGACRAWRA